jgi:class 3 adenylate cyclase
MSGARWGWEGTRGVTVVLGDLFTAFDRLARRHGLEKIKTVGDAYMVAGGLPTPRPDHAQAVAEMALALREEASRHLDPTVGRWPSASASTPARWWPG